MMRYDLIYGGVSSLTYDIYITGEGVYDAPERIVDLVNVPGKNGALTIDQGAFSNISIEYECSCTGSTQEDMRAKFTAFKNALVSQIGYQRLIDSYHPDEFRQALFISGIETTPVGMMNRVLKFKLKFTCKPQRYLTSGDDEITVTNGMVLNNPTLFDSEPLLMVNGYGTISFNGYDIELENGSIGNVVLWQSVGVSKRVATIMQTSITQTFDKSLFEDGDTFTFRVSQSIDAYEDVAGMSATNANATNSWGDNNDGSVRLETVLPCSFAVGTSNTVTNTSTFTFMSTDTLTASMTINYDGDGKVVYTVVYTATNPSNLGIYLNGYMSECSAVSSLTRLGRPTYIDCEIGEAYKYEGDSLIGLNSYIDLGSDLPKLSKGINEFSVDNTITSLKVVPRWWMI